MRDGAGQPDRQVCFACTRRSDQQDVGGRLQVAAGAQLVDQLAVDAGGGVDIEAVQGGGCGYAGEPQPPGQAARPGGVDLDGEQLLQRCCQ
jgi:hypothetical protein